MEIRELRTLCMVAKTGSVSRAAEALAISQPSATRHLQNLEAKLGVRLIRPKRRPLQLTEEGTTLARTANLLLESVDQFQLTAFIDEGERPIRIAATHVLGSHFLHRVVQSFQANHPRNRVQIWSGTRTSILQSLRSGDVDLAFVPNPEVPPQCKFEPLFAFERVLIVPKGHPLTEAPLLNLAQIARYPLIVRRDNPYSRGGLESELRRARTQFRVAVELDNVDAIPRYVALGIGVAVSSRMAVDDWMRDIDVLGLGHLLPAQVVGVAAALDRTLPGSVEDFLTTTRLLAASYPRCLRLHREPRPGGTAARVVITSFAG